MGYEVIICVLAGFAIAALILDVSRFAIRARITAARVEVWDEIKEYRKLRDDQVKSYKKQIALKDDLLEIVTKQRDFLKTTLKRNIR